MVVIGDSILKTCELSILFIMFLGFCFHLQLFGIDSNSNFKTQNTETVLEIIQPITKDQKAAAITQIKSKSNELIEGEKDLATLEEF